MTKTVKRNVVVSAILAIMLCVSLIAGATFALFTSESKVNIAVSSGKVSVIANIDETSVQTKQLYDTDYEDGKGNMFMGEDVATFTDDGLTLNNVVPGDGIKFNIVVKNESTVSVQYRTIISCEYDDGLFAGLKVNVGDNENYSGVTLVSNWAQLAVDSENAIVPVSIELPEGAGDEYQDKTCTVSYKVEAVQGNAQVENPEEGTIYIYNANDLKALSGKKLAGNKKVELMADVDLNGAEFKEIGVAYGDTLDFKGNGYSISNMKLATGKHGGMTNVGMFFVDTKSTLNVESLKLVTPVVEDAIDEYATGAAAVVGYADGNSKVTLTDVDVENANINNTFGNAAIYVGYATSTITMTDCDVTASTASGEVENGVVRTDKTGAFFGSANQEYVYTLTNCTNDTNLPIAGRVINNATLTFNGAYYVTTASGFTSALASGDTVNIILADGTYENVLTASNETINIVGENEDGAEIALTKTISSSHDHLGLDGCTVTLENVKATFEDDAYYAAYIRHNGMTYTNCTIIGQQYIYGDVSFIGCTFDNDDGAATTAMRYTYIYDGDVLVDNCDFYTQGHGLIMFKDQGVDHTLTVKDSRFHGGAGRKAGVVANQNTAAIEIDGSCGANYTLNLEGNNTFDEGFSGLWRIKSMKDGVSTKVNGVEYVGGTDTVYKDGIKYYKDADKNVYAYDGEYILVTSTAELIYMIKTGPVNDGIKKIALANGTYAGAIDITIAELGNGAESSLYIKAATGAFPVITGTVTLGYRNQGVSATMWNGDVVFEGITFDHALAENHSINVEDVKSLTLTRCKIIGNGEYGITSARGNGTGASKIEYCEFENAGMQLLGNFATGLVIDNCTFNSSRVNVQAGNGVTISNCTFNDKLTSANLGESFYLIRSNSTPITVMNCVFNIDSDLTEVAQNQEKWGIMWNRGTTDWTISDVTIDKTEAAASQTELLDTKCTGTGAINVVG